MLLLSSSQIFNPALVRDGIFSTGCSQDGDSSLQIYGLRSELENTVRYYAVTVRGDGCDPTCELLLVKRCGVQHKAAVV